MSVDETVGEEIAFAHAVAGDFDFLALLHDREPSAAIIGALRACDVASQLGVRLESAAGQEALSALSEALAALPRDVDGAVLDELAAGYADVYLRHTYRAAPTESVWLTEDGLERQAPMFVLRETYYRHNLRATDWAGRGEDHLVVQLRFIAHLLQRAKSLDDLAMPTHFLDDHLLRWLKPFALRLINAGAPDYYAATALLTAAYVEEIRDNLGAITGIARPVAPKPVSAEQRAAEAQALLDEAAYMPGVAPSW